VSTDEINVPPNVLLSGIVGSAAYGLATEDSDVDRLGVFAAPTEKLIGLHPVQQSIVSTKPDATFHEAGKFAALALKVNPTITELMWLPDDLYEVRTELGDNLIAIRHRFLSRAAVRNAYLGYATQQFRRLENRGDGSFSADTRKRTAKHARHLYRLHAQGIMLWQTGRLTVRLPHGDAVLCRAFGDNVAAGNLEAGRGVIAWAEHIFDTSKTPLPERPDEATVEAWLQEVRREHYRMEVPSGMDR
jgi:predicted nucleotidyltransferase